MDRMIMGVAALLGLPYTDAVVAAGALVLGVTAGVLGSFAVLRGSSLVGDAVAHSTLPGVCVAFMVTGVKDVAGLLAGAAVAGLVAAVLMTVVERTRLAPDAAIGVVLSGFFALGIVLLTHIANAGDANQAGLEHYLFGQAAGLLARDVTVMAVVGGAGVLVVVALRRALMTSLFDRGYAAAAGLPVRALDVLVTALLVAAVVVGVRVVGAILMVAMLVVPTVVARQLADRFGPVLVLAGVTGAVVGITGSLLATRAELPTGPVVVLVGVAFALAAVLFAPGRGVLARAAALRRRRRALVRARVLVAAAETGRVPPERRVRRALRRDGLVDADGLLTAAGRAAAADLVERTVLWQAWLEHGASFRLPDAREPNPADLRRSLDPRSLARLRRLAGLGPPVGSGEGAR